MEKTMEYNTVVYAVSDNIISSLGSTTKENISSLLEGKCGIKPVSDEKLYPNPFLASLIGRERMEQDPLIKGLSGFHRLEQLMILSLKDALNRSKIDPASDETIFIFSTTKGNIDLLEKKETLDPDVELGQMARRISGYWNAKNKPLVISNACISGVLAVILGERLLKSGKYKNAVLVGGDLSTEFVISGFQSFNSVSPAPCKPYDRYRDGLSMGEGVATLILSSDREMVTDTFPVMVAGGSSSNDANHISGPSRTGDGLWYAIRDALSEAGITAKDIDLVNPHGTATVYNDEMESKALELASLSDCPLMGLKGFFGHTLGAAGLIESVICIESLRRQTQFSTKGFSELGVPVPVNVTTEAKSRSLRNILKTASGFGGCNAAVVYSLENSGCDYKVNPDGTSRVRECLIENKKVIRDYKTVFDGSGCEDFAAFIRAAFKFVSQPYMKFSKMDDLCKLGLTAVEYLLEGVTIREKYDPRDIAMIFANRYSSLDTDVVHQQIINNKEFYQPSPAVFVYTLANIVMGEIAIRQKLQGENLFLVAENRDEKLLKEQVDILFSTGKAKACIAGWVDYFQGEYIAHLFLFEKMKMLQGDK
jgi:3-oxoacyl-(acyl-carrier-protein) synthase